MTRLRDMGIEPFLLSSSLLGVLAQRLVRSCCPHCKHPHPATPADCEVLGVNPADAARLSTPGRAASTATSPATGAAPASTNW
ncbi:MAG: hypothetical protein MZV65_17325 [Chromatiales bacterium]|nr:hypothetical protein [Chromatiales bacterium]